MIAAQEIFIIIVNVENSYVFIQQGCIELIESYSKGLIYVTKVFYFI